MSAFDETEVMDFDLNALANTQDEDAPGSSKKKQKTAIHLDKSQLNQLIGACATFSAIDKRPFDFVEKDGFAELATALFNLGASFQKPITTDNMRQILPGRTSVRNRVVDMGKNNVKESVSKLKEYLEAKNTIGVGFATDIWTEPFENLAYMSLTAHYVHGRKLISCLLCLKPLLKLENKKGETIKLELDKMIKSIGLEKSLKRSTFVTDRGGNIVKALNISDINRMPCFAHLLNNLSENTFMKIEEISNHITATKEIVTWFKKSAFMSELDSGITLKQEAKTRFNSIKSMFESVKVNYPQILEIVQNKKPDLLPRVHAINMPMIDALLPFLEELKKYTLKTEGEKYPTLYQVWPAKLSILDYCRKHRANEPQYLKTLKKLAIQYIDSNFEIIDYHKFATYLTPKYKELNFVDDEIKQEVISKLRAFMNTIENERSEIEIEVDSDSDPFAVAYDFNSSTSIDEIELYSNKSVSKEIKCLDFWFDNQMLFPKLSQIAFFVHGITATSCSDERIFSTAANIKNRKRNRINHNELLHVVAASNK